VAQREPAVADRVFAERRVIGLDVDLSVLRLQPGQRVGDVGGADAGIEEVVHSWPQPS